MSYSVRDAMRLVPIRGADEDEAKPDLMSVIHNTAANDSMYGAMSEIVSQRRKRNDSDVMAKRMITNLADRMSEPEEDEEEGGSTFMKYVFKALKFIGKKIFGWIVRPIIRFAARVLIDIVSIALRTIVTYVVMPLISVIGGFIVANPILVLGGLAVGGLAWWVWNKFGKNRGGANPDDGGMTTYEPAVEAQLPKAAGKTTQVAAPTVNNPLGTKTVAIPMYKSPTKMATELLGKPGKGKGEKFAGFGDDIDGYIKEASKSFGLPEDILRGFVKMEAGWTGKMSPTGAIGTGQFIYNTWNGLAAQPAGRAIGMVAITSKTFRTPQDPRFDMHVNTLATALLAKQNADQLTHNKIPVTGENLYMMHNIGPGIMNVMLGKPISKATLTAMQQNGMKVGMSPADFLAYQQGRFNAQYAIANNVEAPTATKVASAVTPSKSPVFLANAKKPVVPQAATVNPPPSTDALGAVGPADKTLIRGPGKTLLQVNT